MTLPQQCISSFYLNKYLGYHKGGFSLRSLGITFLAPQGREETHWCCKIYLSFCIVLAIVFHVGSNLQISFGLSHSNQGYVNSVYSGPHPFEILISPRWRFHNLPWQLVSVLINLQSKNAFLLSILNFLFAANVHCPLCFQPAFLQRIWLHFLHTLPLHSSNTNKIFP